MSRWACAAIFWVLLGSRAWAQAVPPPPAAYSAASIGLDLVLEPLASAAEADLSRGEASLALARAEMIVREAPAASAVHVRAEGLVLLAQQRLAQTSAAAIDAEIAYAPIVDAAGDDVGAGRFDLGRARLHWALTHVPTDGALALRASAISAALEVRAREAASRPSSAPTVAAPTWTPPPSAPPAPDGHRPHRRTDLEMVDLYVTAGLMGAYFGAWIPESGGLIDHSSSEDASRVLSLAMIAGAGVLTLGVFGLDQIDDGPRAGQPSAIAGGIRFGFVLSGLTLGVLAARTDFRTGEMFDAMGIGLVGGAAIGAVFAYAAEPHPAQVQFSQASGVWGGVLGAELAAIVAPLAFPNLGADHDRMEAGFGVTLGGLSAGLVTGIALAAAHENFSARRSWLTTLGLVVGTGAGSIIWLIVSEATHANFDVPTWGGLAGSLGLGGLILAALLTSGDHGEHSWDDPPPVQVSIAPTLGGATLGLEGSF